MPNKEGVNKNSWKTKLASVNALMNNSLIVELSNPLTFSNRIFVMLKSFKISNKCINELLLLSETSPFKPFLVKGWQGGDISIVSTPMSFISVTVNFSMLRLIKRTSGKLCLYTKLAFVFISTLAVTSKQTPLSKNK